MNALIPTSSGYISKHRKYVDKRIALINDYVASTPSEASIPEIVYSLIDNQRRNEPLFPDDICDAIQDLQRIIDPWDILCDGDIVGYIYQQLQPRDHKKSKGQYFTPDNIVSYIISTSIGHVIKERLRILDPACGSGQFLIAAVKYLCGHHRIDQNDKDRISTIIKESIYGFDIDPVAVAVARFNLSKISGCDAGKINVHQSDFLSVESLIKEKNFNSTAAFDVITGNPPWGSKISNEAKRYYYKNYYSARSGINTFTLFIERSFEMVAPGGIISFLIPEAYLNIKAHKNSRQHVLENSKVSSIALWGERFKGVFAPSVSIILQQENSSEIRGRNIVEIHCSRNRHDIATMIPQRSFYSHPDHIFNIHYSRKAVSIIDSIANRDCFYLRGKARFFLGIVTGNNALHISRKQNQDYPDEIVTGRDVQQYRISFSSHYFNFDREKLQQVAPRALYIQPNKILYKFIGKRLTFALDSTGRYTLNNVNGFIPQYGHINIESTLSVLNSAVMQYYYEKNFFTIKVLRGNLEQLPIRMISVENQKKLRNLADEVIGSGNTNIAARQNIEDIIFHEYGIADRQAHYITDYLGQPLTHT